MFMLNKNMLYWHLEVFNIIYDRKTDDGKYRQQVNILNTDNNRQHVLLQYTTTKNKFNVI